MKKHSQSISIIFPAYNEEKNIAATVNDAFSFAKENFNDFEIIVVNDGSKDNTCEEVQKIAKKTKKIKLINNRVNLGYGATVWRGLKAAKSDLIFFSDADRQFDIKEIKKILRQVEKYDVVVGFRRKRQDSYLRKLNAFGWKLLIRLMLNLRIRDIDCAFKLFKREVIEKLKIKSTGATFSAELIYEVKKTGFSILEVPVNHYPRLEGKPTGAKLSVISKAFRELWGFYLKQEDLVRSKSKWVYWGAAIVLFLSRIFLRSNSLDFFDSSEYMWRANDPSLLKAMATGHAPFHPLYVFFGWLLHFSPFKFSEVVSLELTSAILGSLSIIFLFLFVRKLFNSRVAWLSSIIYALLPFVFVSQITVLVDATEHVFYFLSLYLWLVALDAKSLKGKIFSLFAGLSFGLAGFAHTQVGIWGVSILALPIATQFKLNKKYLIDLLVKFLLFALGGAFFILLYLKLLVFANSIGWHDPSTSMKEAFKYLVFGNIGDRDPIELKKAFYYLVSLASSLVVLSAAFGAIRLFIYEKRKFLFILLWFLPFLLGSTYIYENLYARTLIIGLAPVAVLASYFILGLKKGKFWAIFLVIAQLCLLSFPVVYKYYTLPAPIEHIKNMVFDVKPGGVFVSSNLTKTLANSAYDGEFVNFGDVGNGAGYVEDKVKSALDKNLPAYVLSDAIILPYHRYDGAYYDLRSTGVGSSSEHTSMLDHLISNFSLSLEKVDDLGFDRALYEISKARPDDEYQKIENNLVNSPIIFGQVKSDQSPVSGLIVNGGSHLICGASEFDITRLDLGFCLLRSFGAKRYSVWTYTDRDGRFAFPVKQGNSEITLSANAAETKSLSLGNAFAKQGDISTSFIFVGEFSDLQTLRAQMDQLDSFYVVSQMVNSKPSYKLYKFDFVLPTSSVINARDLGGVASEIIKDSGAPSKNIRASTEGGGFVLSGPYKDLKAGKYRVSYKVRSPKEQDRKIIFDVSSDYAKEVLGTYEKNQKELAGKNYKEVSVEFEIKEEKKAVEFRVKVEEDSSLFIDSVSLIAQ